MARVHAGDHDGGRALLEEGLATGFMTQKTGSWATGMVCWAEAAAMARHAPAAEALRPALRPFAHLAATSGVTVHPAICHTLGTLDHVLGDLDGAVTWSEQADALHRNLASPLLIAYSDAARAAVLADRGQGDDHDRARRLATQALEASTSGGYGDIARTATEALEQLT
jgi:ATP/maltotriose-dependent transcriptional regulator MalT